MKRSLGVFAALPLCFAAATASAQGIGIKGGAVWNDVSNRGALPGSLEGRTGWTAGLTFSTLKGPIGVGLDAMYAQRGLHSSSGSANSRRFEYIDIPAYLRVMIPVPGVGPYLLAGPQVSFELSCRGGALTCNPDRPKTSYAGVIGAGLYFGERGGFSIEGRYMYGLTDLKLDTVTSSESYKTRSFLVLAGIQF